MHVARVLVVLACFIPWSVAVTAPGGNDAKGRDALGPSNFQFARVQFNSYDYGRRTPGWAHDYPRAERNFLKILSELTRVETTPESYVIVRLDDPQIMDYPLLYFSEPGTWAITEEEAANLRAYLHKGGFAIFDDFDGPYQWNNFERCMKQVFPDQSLQKLTLDHPIFQCFFGIETLNMVPPYGVWGEPTFYGLSDEKGRLQVVVNFNNDIGDYWEWSDQSLVPINLSNEAYKFGVNYVLYALTH